MHTGRREMATNIQHGHSYDPKRNSTSAFTLKIIREEKIITHTLPQKHSQHPSHLKRYNAQKQCQNTQKEIFVNRHSP